MLPRGRFWSRYFCRWSVRSITTSSRGNPTAVATKIFTHSVKTYRSSGRTSLMRFPSRAPAAAGGPLAHPVPPIRPVTAASRVLLVAHSEQQDDAHDGENDVRPPHRPEGRDDPLVCQRLAADQSHVVQREHDETHEEDEPDAP